jgi:hypothetical protein
MESDVEAIPMTQEVIAADREAAWPFAPSCVRDDPNPGAEQRWLEGRYDAMPILQAFAAHRLAHLPNTGLSEERAREVLADALEENEQMASAEAARNGAIGSWFVPSFVVIRAMQQYAAGLQVENAKLRERLNSVLFAIGQPLDCDGNPFSTTALGDTQ